MSAYARGPKRQDSPQQVLARAAAAAKRTELEDKLAWQIHAWGLPTPERQFRFDPVRLWRFDFAWPEFKLAVEVEGLTAPWQAPGRHQRVQGYSRDVEKYNAAQLAGWKVLRFTRELIKNTVAVRSIETALAQAAHLPGGRA